MVDLFCLAAFADDVRQTLGPFITVRINPLARDHDRRVGRILTRVT